MCVFVFYADASFKKYIIYLRGMKNMLTIKGEWLILNNQNIGQDN